MNVSLTPELEAMVRKKVESGRYASASEVIRDALRVMDERETRLENLRSEIQIGLDQAKRGELTPYSTDTMNQLIRESEEAHKQGKPVSDFIKP